MKYNYYEIVRIISASQEKQEINNKTGIITGYSDNEFGECSYAIMIIETEEVWSIEENEFEPLGETLTESGYYNREYLRFLNV